MSPVPARSTPAPTWSLKAQPREKTIEVIFKVVTPVFGGGVRIDPECPHQKPIDPITPVRAASIRGHLRFWWREWYKTQGNHDVAAMREREGEIWGLASQPGQVRIAVMTQPTKGQSINVYELRQRPNGKWGLNPIASELAYGAFPLQTPDAQLQSPDRAIREAGPLTPLSGPVKLRLNFPTKWSEDVNAALDLWLSFGGIGGRTRRGFGAISTERGRAQHLGFETFEVARGNVRTAQSALEAGLEKYKNFRQARGPGRERRPGRSKWPEPDEIRRLTNQWHRDHEPRCEIRKFPRAAFGLPIIFHFKDRDDPQPQITLQPKGLERMASPLILRPINRGDSWVCIGLRLPHRMIRELEVKGRNWTINGALSHQDAKQLGLPGNEADVIQAFANYCRNR